MHRAACIRIDAASRVVRLLIGVVVLGFDVSAAISQDGVPPADRPLQVDESVVERIQAAIEPFVQMGRQTFPTAKERYLRGLPGGYSFYVSTDLNDAAGRFEQVFVYVTSIDNQMIVGNIASEISVVSGYEIGGQLILSESRIKDWTIVGPDGTEEGNFVGRFVDHYSPGRVLAAIMGFLVSDSGAAYDIRVAQVLNDRGEPVNVDLPAAWIAVASQIIENTQSAPTTGEVFVPLVYDPDRPSEPLYVAQ